MVFFFDSFSSESKNSSYGVVPKYVIISKSQCDSRTLVENQSGFIFAQAISRISSVSVYWRRCDQEDHLCFMFVCADHARSRPDRSDRNNIGEAIFTV